MHVVQIFRRLHLCGDSSDATPRPMLFSAAYIFCDMCTSSAYLSNISDSRWTGAHMATNTRQVSKDVAFLLRLNLLMYIVDALWGYVLAV